MSNLSGAVIVNLSPLLFLIFRESYGISYGLLGLLVVINFATQLLIDLIFSFFSSRFNIHKAVRLMPVIAAFGLAFYGIMPLIFPQSAYLWIAVGTVIFSISGGLGEVLISPVIAAIPAENPEREMSKLHSVYAWGVVFVVLVSTVFINVFGGDSWSVLALIWAALPLATAVLFALSPLPDMSAGESAGGEKKNGLNVGLLICFALIFLGGAAECTMAQWVSGFAEAAIGLPKLVGDVVGVAGFAAMLGIGRTLYSRIGKKVIRVMLFGMIGASVCYVAAAASTNPWLSLAACAVTGLCTSMLWPGTLIYADEKVKNLGVSAYALLAAGGDMGASVAPQLVGIVSDSVGMREGILLAAIFPILGVVLILIAKKYFKKKELLSVE